MWLCIDRVIQHSSIVYCWLPTSHCRYDCGAVQQQPRIGMRRLKATSENQRQAKSRRTQGARQEKLTRPEPLHSKRAIFDVFRCSISIKNKWKATLSFGASQHWCVQASIRFVWLESKIPSSNGVRHVPKSTFLMALKTCYFWRFPMLDFNQKQMKSYSVFWSISKLMCSSFD